jgi:hypothetical protein
MNPTLHIYIYTSVVFDSLPFLLVFVSSSSLTCRFQIFSLVRFILILCSCVVCVHISVEYTKDRKVICFVLENLTFFYISVC